LTRKAEYCVFTRISQIDRSDKTALVHHCYQSRNHVGDKAKGAGLFALAVNANVFSLKCLNNEITDNSAVIDSHPGTVGIEDSDNPNIYGMLPIVIHHQTFGDSLPLVIATTDTDRVDVPPIIFSLRMNLRIAVHFRSRSL